MFVVSVTAIGRASLGHRSSVVVPARELTTSRSPARSARVSVLAVGQPVPGGDRRHPLLLVDEAGGEQRVGDGAAYERDVDVGTAQAAESLLAAAQLDRPLRVRVVPGPHDAHGVGRRGPGVAEAQRADAGHDRRERLVERADRLLRRRAEPLAGVREGEVMRRALDEVHAEALLELAQRTGERGLREVQALGGPRDVALLGDREEGAQVAGLDGHTCEHNPVPTGISRRMRATGRLVAWPSTCRCPARTPLPRADQSRRATAPAARAGVAMVTSAIVWVQLGAAVARLIFDRVGPSGVVFLRLLIAAVVLLVFSRPRLRGRTRADWQRRHRLRRADVDHEPDVLPGRGPAPARHGRDDRAAGTAGAGGRALARASASSAGRLSRSSASCSWAAEVSTSTPPVSVSRSRRRCAGRRTSC